MNVFDILREKLEKEKNSNSSLIEQAEYYRNGLEEANKIVNQVEREFGNPTLCYLGSPCEYQNEDVKHGTTNADRIRAMSDEELAFIIMCPYDTYGEPTDIMPCIKDGNIQESVSQENCMACTREWLQKEAK